MASKVSIIIPVHNTEPYLEQCLKSVVNQTYRDIEIIVVDDNSSDGSRELINGFAESDDRIVVRLLDKDSGTLVARNEGIRLSSGKYICFVDSDDYLEPDAIESVTSKMDEVQVDILHFSVKIWNIGGVSEKRMKQNRAFMAPFPGRLEGNDIFTKCFVDQRYGFTIWNKLFNAELCRSVLPEIEDIYMPKAQDLYLFFVLAHYAGSYYGWESKEYYNYCLGRGFTGSEKADLERLKRFSAQKTTYDALVRFISGRKEAITDYDLILGRYKRQWEGECIKILDSLPEEDVNEGVKIILSYWSKAELAEGLAGVCWTNRAKAGKLIQKIDHTPMSVKKNEVIALYYHRLSLGGAQKVMYLMGCMLINMGYKVVLVTDEEETPNGYRVPGADRVLIRPSAVTNKTNYALRGAMWQSVIDDYDVDVVIYNAWESEMLMWDTFLFRLKDVSIISYNHCAFSNPLTRMAKSFSNKTYALAAVDGMIVLSEADRVFWSAFSDHVYHLPNPIEPKLRNISLTGEPRQNHILWIARLSDEKRPLDAVKIMALVKEAVPDAVLFMVGDSPDPKQMEALKSEIAGNDLGDSVVVAGFQTDPDPYYRTAKLVLSTSHYEGYPMVLIEAEAYGLPVVMYDIYHLDLNKDEYGVTAVPHCDLKRAAGEIIKLLSDDSLYKRRCEQVQKAFAELSAYDLEAAWDDILHGRRQCEPIDKNTKEMIRLIRDHYADGYTSYDKKMKKAAKDKKALEKNITELTEIIDKREKELNDIKTSATYRFAKCLSAPFRALKKIIKRKR